jgi:hypothetical protein
MESPETLQAKLKKETWYSVYSKIADIDVSV